MPPTPRPSPASHSRTTRALAVAVLVASALVLALAWRSAEAERRHEYLSAERATQDLAGVLEQAFDSQIKQIDIALQAAKEELERQAAIDALRGPELEAFIGRLVGRLPQVDGLRFADATGRVRVGTGVAPGSKVEISDRAYFVRARSVPNAGMIISEPIVSRISGRWSIIFARRVEAADRSFGGVVYAAVAIEQFTRILSRVNVGQDGAVLLRGGAMELIARYPARQESGRSVGEKAASRRLVDAVESGVTRFTHIATSQFDGIERVVSYQRVDAYPLHLVVAISSQEFLEGWRRDAVRSAILVGLFALLISISALFLDRYLRRETEDRVRRQVEEAQERNIAELRTALAEVKTLSGLLPICSHCKKIRDDQGYWKRIESYIRERSNAEFTHGICPDCAERYFPSGR